MDESLAMRRRRLVGSHSFIGRSNSLRSLPVVASTSCSETHLGTFLSHRMRIPTLMKTHLHRSQLPKRNETSKLRISSFVIQIFLCTRQ